MAPTDQFLSFKTTDNTKYFLWSQWHEKDGKLFQFGATLLSGVKAWHGIVPIESLTKWANEAGVELDEFITWAKEALAGVVQDEGTRTIYKYDVKLEFGVAKLTWKKQISETANFQLGTIEMGKVDENWAVFTAFMEHCGDRFELLTKRVHSLEEENYRLSDEHKRAMERLTEASQAKMDVEDRLLGTFTDVLNAKKQKIVELTEAVDQLQETINSGGQIENEPDDIPQSSAVTSKTSGKKAPVRSKPLNDEDEGDTDEEREQYEHVRQEKAKKRNVALDDMQLVMTSGNNKEKRTGHQEPVDDGDDDALFVPKKRQRGRPQKTGPLSVETRSKPSAAAVSSVSPSIDLNSPRKTRSSTGGSMNLISKLT